MGRKGRLTALFFGMALTVTGCAELDSLREIPREYALSAGVSSEAPESVSEESVEEPVGTEEASLPEEPAENFLMEEVYPYAFYSLSGAEQIWYRDMERILGSFSARQELSKEGLDAGLGEKDIDKIFQCVLGDHPELFYVDGYSYTKYSRGKSLVGIKFSGSYNVELDTALRRTEEIAAAADRILAGIGKDASDYEKVKYVYDTVIQETDYDLESPDNQNIYSVFVNHFSVCQGYAKAAQYLLNKLGVGCTLVLGTVETGEGHAWNLVKIDEAFYYMDTTWGDVSYQVEDLPDRGADGQSVMPEINYDYLNVTTEELLRTHTIGGVVPMPVCVSNAANYYVREGAYFVSYDKEQMEALLRKVLEEGRRDVTVKCADAVCYGEMVDGLIKGQDIFKYLPEAKDRIAYAQNEKQLSLTFWVTNE